ncbi:sel1 repeat family protein [Pseudotabrizicola algicola]|uniref:Sel1 repeat family protein n=1 Tax=Pseudotabrizicola algicola TaxID=2709381 RepID=A0A6B3RP72_9RHOB|nr:sel1 repeat family protein [Pseudotabrizicola algicola]NEX47944.1 sel1 repeat family protein [Pseudotabrizicola algicola]
MRAVVGRAGVALLLGLSPVAAETDAYGSLNPDEMSLQRMVEDAERGNTSMSVCASGYLMTKSGRHGAAREVFTRCAEDGYTAAMTWMSQLEDNGFGAPENPDAAAAWDRRAAELGDPVGMFNYGLDMMRGRGVAQDEAAGRQMIDRAAALGLPVARRLQDAGYDLDEITPDADNWKYAPLF